MFACALRPGGEPLSRDALLAGFRNLRNVACAPVETLQAGPFTAAAVAGSRPLLASWRSYAAVGDIRIDNRSELETIAGGACHGESDLALLLRAYGSAGEGVVARLTGDFAFVLWDARAQKLIAARDAFGVRALYSAQAGRTLRFASHATLLHEGGGYDVAYIAGFISGRPEAAGRTLWSDVQSVAAGGLLVQRGTVLRQGLHWNAEALRPRDGSATPEDVEGFRSLLTEAVRTQMGRPEETWAHLSGGLDSSSIAAVAARDGGGLAGTLTVVDTLGAGDERAFSNEVAQRYGLRNEQVTDYWAWQDDGGAPPHLDQPWPLYPFYARDRRMRSVVRAAGARVVLAGVGADHYLTGNLGYIPDLVANGQPRLAIAELAAWAANTRQSFWSMAHRLLTKPALDAVLRRGARAIETPPWLRAHEAAGVQRSPAELRTKAGSSFATGIVREMRTLPAWIERYGYGPDVELRYPFLYRPLVEFSLALPADARIRSPRTKWILREAMRDVLPERVRKRATKGAIDARILWSLNREARRIDALLHEPVLADLGVVCADTLRAAVARAREGICPNPVHLMSSLALETWLAVQDDSAVMAATAASHAA
jgi:asparagine synthase (glutamine-hydrolysing)